MIISFSVSNFRSFASEETFSLVATKDAASHPNHLVDIPNSKERALRTGVIYGANGAGKSNLFKALAYMKDLVIRPRPKNVGTDRDPFLLTTEPPAPTSLELQFIAGDTHYRLGLKVDDQSILEEWLVRVKGGREAVVYERPTSANGVVTTQLSFLPPASSSATEVCGSSDSRPATAQPPEPPPTTTKSYVSVTRISPILFVIPGRCVASNPESCAVSRPVSPQNSPFAGFMARPVPSGGFAVLSASQKPQKREHWAFPKQVHVDTYPSHPMALPGLPSQEVSGRDDRRPKRWPLSLRIGF